MLLGIVDIWQKTELRVAVVTGSNRCETATDNGSSRLVAEVLSTNRADFYAPCCGRITLLRYADSLIPSAGRNAGFIT